MAESAYITGVYAGDYERIALLIFEKIYRLDITEGVQL